jgi:hypothetical protein
MYYTIPFKKGSDMKICILAFAFTLVASMAIGQQPTWTDPATGLMWTTKDNGSDVNLKQASNYCQNLSLGGYSGWRLPTIDELAGIYDETQLADDRHIKGGIMMTGWEVWSSSAGNDSSWQAWVLDFGISGGGRRRDALILGHNSIRALCVRRSGK